MGASNKKSGAWSIVLVVALGFGALLLVEALPGFLKSIAENTESTTRTNPQGPVRTVEDDGIPEDHEIPQAWNCFWDPTMNDNWHDDVYCSNGPEGYRPVLLAGVSFVTEDDMRQAAQEHEAYLNGGGVP